MHFHYDKDNIPNGKGSTSSPPPPNKAEARADVGEGWDGPTEQGHGGCASLRGWQNTVGNLIEICWVKKTIMGLDLLVYA